MAVGIVTGSGSPSLANLRVEQRHEIETPWGSALISAGRFAGIEVLHVSRHGERHERLSNHVNFRANLWALRELGTECVLAVTACGAVDPSLELGSLIVFDDLHFPSNRLPDGSLCTFHVEPGDPRRGHWVFARPFSEPLRRALLDGALSARSPVRDGGCYGHVDGPRFNTRTEIRSLAAIGVAAVSQTGGPEAVLCGELGLPYALIGFATDYANGVSPEPTPLDTLRELMGHSGEAFQSVLGAAIARIDPDGHEPVGSVFGFS